jgi:hypothetical protein
MKEQVRNKLQCWTAKHDNLARSGTGFFSDKWTSDLNSEGLKMSKNTFFMIFPRVFGGGRSQRIFLLPLSGDFFN